MTESKLSALRAGVERLLARVMPPGSHAESGDPGLVEVATRALDSRLDRWIRLPALRQLVGGLDHDALTGPGEWVELRAQLGVAGRLGLAGGLALAGSSGERATFTLAGQVVAEVAIGHDAELRAMVRAPDSGVYPIGVQIASGALAAELAGHRVLHVTGVRPVVLFHVASLLRADASVVDALATLRGLADAGFELAYFDLHAKDRERQIREAFAAHGIPPAALLVVSNEEQDLGTPDLPAMLLTAAVRRLRGRGVPVTMVVSDELSGGTPAPPRGVVFLGVAAARDAIVHDAVVVEHRDAAVAFDAERRANDRVTWRLDQTTDSELVAGNAFVAELDNRRARERLFELVAGARRSVHVQLYILRDSSFAERLTVLLIQRARAGVHVRFMVDALYSDAEVLGRNNPLLQALEAEPNIDVLALGRIESRRDVELVRLRQRDHRKLVVVDDAVAIVSGRNASDEYYAGFDEVPVHDQTPHDRIPWLDAHVELRGPLVADVQRSFRRTWLEQGGAAIDEPEPTRTTVARAGTAAGRLVVHRGLADTHAMAMYETMLECAEHHVLIVNDFPIVAALGHAIRRVLARGVVVKLLTGNAAARRADGTFFPAPLHRTLFELMVKARIEPLLAAGVEVYEYVPPPSPQVVARGGVIRPYVHAKLMAVDGAVASIGSANLDATASFWESEANIVVQDADFVRALEADLERHIAGSVRVDPHSAYWLGERAQRAVVATLWPDSLYS